MPENTMIPNHIDMLYRTVCDFDFLAEQLIAAVCLALLCRDFIKGRRAAGLVGGVYFAAVVLLYYVPFQIGNFAAYSLALTAAFGVFVWLDRRNVRMKIYLIATFFVIRWISFSMSNKISNLLFEAVTKITDEFVDLSNPAIWKLFFMEFVIYTLFDLAWCGVVLFLLVRGINKALPYKREDLELRELFFMIIPSVNGMVVYGIFRFYADVYERETKISIFQTHLLVELLWVLCYAVMLAGIVNTILLYQHIRKKREEESARLILESQMRDMQTHISEVERLYSGIRGVKHDIKNHIEVIDSLLAEGKTREARAYSKSLSEAAETFDFAVRTGNPITDVILHEKAQAALLKGIRFTADFHYPQDPGVNAFDVSVVLSNALSNAIEAAQAGGFVKVSSFREKNACLITVENSFDGRLDIDEESGLPKTKKGDKDRHGFGLQNIKSVAAKYHGDMLMERKKDRVSLTVMLLNS